MKSILMVLFLLGAPLSRAEAFRPFDPAHTAWSRWLKEFAPGGKLVDYSRAKTDQRSLRDYLASLSAVSPRVFSGWPPARRLAFLLNAYNAFSVRLVVDNYPLKSVKDLSSPLRSIWRQSFVPLLGENESLDGIEAGRLRKEFPDPRIHFAIGCVTKGGPDLGDAAWTEEGLETRLERAAREFVTDSSKNRYDPGKNRFEVSPLFEWYEADFKGRYGSLAKFLASYFGRNDEERAKMAEARISFTPFDWSLNDVKLSPGS